MSSRRDARKNVLLSADFQAAIADIKARLAGKQWALIGGLAAAAHANPPVTVDIDILMIGDHSQELSDEMRYRMSVPTLKETPSDALGWGMDRLWFPTSQLHGLPKRGWQFHHRTEFVAELDVLITDGDAFLTRAVESAVVVARVPAKVITAEDLIITKSLVGRDKDWDDILDLQRTLEGKLDEAYVERMLNELM